MDVIRVLADLSIRRACGFAGLGIGVMMLALSFDVVLACRAGAGLTALLCLGLVGAAWRAPRRDVRRTELWALLAGTTGELARRLPPARAQELLGSLLQERLLWHAERVGVIALALWLVTGVAALLLAILG